jgi:hypothetical protein
VSSRHPATLLSQIHKQLTAGRFEFSRHAFRRAVERNISDREIREAGAKAGIIEGYPEDKIPRARCYWDLRQGQAAAFSSIVYRDTANENHHDLRTGREAVG